VSAERVVAVLGRGVVPPGTPILRGDDLGVLRGDGIFETAHVRGGTAWLLEQHLDRMERSAALLELALPHRDSLAELVGQALAAWPAEVEGSIRLVCTRGAEIGPGPVTVFATVAPVPAAVVAARTAGIAVRTATIGLPAELRPGTPWLLGGAKTVSYAVNLATQRWAQDNGADDALWVSADGYALEGPTSTLVWLADATLWTVPAPRTGILAGITARYLLDHADALGLRAGEAMVTPAQLRRTEGVWFTASVRGVAALTSLDGDPLPVAAELSARIRELLGFS
jgi:4-amino-4-deoxychorismate lyase